MRSNEADVWQLPEQALGTAWARTLDLLRPQRQRDESFYEWRQHPARPVTFQALNIMQADIEQLHLSHPAGQAHPRSLPVSGLRRERSVAGMCGARSG